MDDYNNGEPLNTCPLSPPLNPPFIVEMLDALTVIPPRVYFHATCHVLDRAKCHECMKCSAAGESAV